MERKLFKSTIIETSFYEDGKVIEYISYCSRKDEINKIKEYTNKARISTDEKYGSLIIKAGLFYVIVKRIKYIFIDFYKWIKREPIIYYELPQQ